MWPDRVKLQLNFDVEKMKCDVRLLDSIEWVSHFVKQNYLGDWSIIPLRGPAHATHPILMSHSNPGCNEFTDTPYLQNLNYIPKVLNTFMCPLLSVRLMKLTAGSEIKRHIDYDLSVEMGTVRLHIPIITHNKVTFWVNDKVVPCNAGECWYLRLTDPHYVTNESDIDRVHLVLDVTVNAWLERMLYSAQHGH